MRAFKFLVIFSCLISLVFSFTYVRENALNILDPIIQDHEATKSAEPKIQQITPEIPRYNLVQNKPISENSYINLPISLKIDDLEHLIRSNMSKNPIYKGEGKKGKTLTYTRCSSF